MMSRDWPKIEITINIVDSGVSKKIDELIEIVKGQQVDTAQVRELERRLEAQSQENAAAVKEEMPERPMPERPKKAI